MKEHVIVRRYAEAFISYAKDTIGLHPAIEEFRVLKWIAVENKPFMKFLNNPGMMESEKLSFLNKVLGGRFSPELLDFLKLLIEKHRVKFLVDIADYIRVNYAREGAIETVVQSAYPLEMDILTDLKKKLEKKMDRPVKLYLSMDPDLKAGIKVIMGNTVIDGSIRKRLAELKEKLRALSVV